jgi:uncharacterized membrane protein
MDKKKYQLYRLSLTIIIAVIVAWSIAAEASVIIPLAAIGAGMLILYLLKRRLKDVIEDERSRLINEKTAKTTLSIFLPVFGTAAVILTVIGDNALIKDLEIGTLSSYTACALMILYYIVHIYYERKH